MFESKEWSERLKGNLGDFQRYKSVYNDAMKIFKGSDYELIQEIANNLQSLVMTSKIEPKLIFFAFHLLAKGTETKSKALIAKISTNYDFLLYCSNILERELSKESSERGKDLFGTNIVIAKNIIQLMAEAFIYWRDNLDDKFMEQSVEKICKKGSLPLISYYIGSELLNDHDPTSIIYYNYTKDKLLYIKLLENMKTEHISEHIDEENSIHLTSKEGNTSILREFRTTKNLSEINKVDISKSIINRITKKESIFEKNKIFNRNSEQFSNTPRSMNSSKFNFNFPSGLRIGFEDSQQTQNSTLHVKQTSKGEISERDNFDQNMASKSRDNNTTTTKLDRETKDSKSTCKSNIVFDPTETTQPTSILNEKEEGLKEKLKINKKQSIETPVMRLDLDKIIGESNSIQRKTISHFKLPSFSTSAKNKKENISNEIEKISFDIARTRNMRLSFGLKSAREESPSTKIKKIESSLQNSKNLNQEGSKLKKQDEKITIRRLNFDEQMSPKDAQHKLIEYELKFEQMNEEIIRLNNIISSQQAEIEKLKRNSAGLDKKR